MSARSELVVRSLEIGRGLAVALALWGTGPLVGAAQACDLSVVESPLLVRIDYNPFAIGPSAAPLDIKLMNRGDTDCDLRLSFTNDAGVEAAQMVLGGVSVQFRPRESSGLTEAPAQPGVFAFNVGEQTTGLAQLDAAVLRDAVADAGEYGVDLKLLIKDVDGQLLVAPIPVRLALTATPRAQLNIAGAAGAFGSGSSVEVVDFGEAVSGATRRLYLQVRANARSTLTIKSENRGEMRRVEPVEGAPSITYAAELDGQSVDLTDTWTRAVDPPRTLAGISLPMTLTLGQVDGRVAGPYADLLTIDVSPN